MQWTAAGRCGPHGPSVVPTVGVIVEGLVTIQSRNIMDDTVPALTLTLATVLEDSAEVYTTL